MTQYSEDPYRANDTRLMTPLILMALIIAGGLLFFAYHGGSGPNVAQAPTQQTTH